MHPLQVLREYTGMDRVEFAMTIDRVADFIYQIENGYEAMGKKTALAIADRWRRKMDDLDVTVEDLLRGEGAKKRRGGKVGRAGTR